MDTASILAFNIAILGALISPGPAFLALVRSALTGGRAEGFTCALGLATGSLLWCVLAVLGLTAVFALVPWAYLALKLLGAAYLIWFAVTLWRHAAAAIPRGVSRGSTADPAICLGHSTRRPGRPGTGRYPLA